MRQGLGEDQPVLGRHRRRRRRRLRRTRTEHLPPPAVGSDLEGIVGLIANGVGVDIVSLFDRLRSKGKADEVGGLAYLNALAQNAPSAVSIARNASIVRDRAQKRGLLAVASEMQESVAGTADDAGTLIDRAAAKLEALGEATVKREPKLLAQALADHINLL